MKRALLLTVVLVGLLACTAQAGTIVVPIDSPYPYQRWSDEARIATPPLSVEIKLTPPLDCAEREACAGGPTEIWVTGPIDKTVFLHELGHLFDWQVLTDLDRERFLQIIGRTGRPWDYAEPGVDIHDTSPREFFAMFYSNCAEWGVGLTKPYQRLRALPMWIDRSWVSRAERRQVCELVDGAYAGLEA